jgi:hypothetical protein
MRFFCNLGASSQEKEAPYVAHMITDTKPRTIWEEKGLPQRCLRWEIGADDYVTIFESSYVATL